MRALVRLLVPLLIGSAGCAHLPSSLYAPMQPDGWSAQPVAMVSRFAPEAELDPATRTPVGDDGYYLYILTKAGDWDYRTARAYLQSHGRQPWGHSWIILESPGQRLELGLNGNFGRQKPTYGEGVSQRLRDGDPNPISYLWETMHDGEIESGNGHRTPTFAWRMPITRRHHQLIYDRVMNWNFTSIGVRTNNCVDLVTEAADGAGIHLIHRVRLTLPSELRILGKTLKMWTDPQYRILEYSTPDVLETDLRQLARFGIGRDVTSWYKASDMAAPKTEEKKRTERRSGGNAEDGT
jgi:hypothetical protein